MQLEWTPWDWSNKTRWDNDVQVGNGDWREYPSMKVKRETTKSKIFCYSAL